MERISDEVLEGVETSFNKKIDPVLLKLDACSSKIEVLEMKIAEMEGWVSDDKDAMASYSAKLT